MDEQAHPHWRISCRSKLANEQVVPVTHRAESRWVEFEHLLRLRHDEMRRFAHHLVGDPDRAQDALQEAYLKAFRAFDRFREREPDASVRWLSSIVYHSCIDELRRAKRRRVTGSRLDSSVVDPVPGPERTVPTQVAVREALARLSADSRAAVLLVDEIGLSYRAAAEILRIPEGTVASRLSGARAALRSALGDRETQEREAHSHG